MIDPKFNDLPDETKTGSKRSSATGLEDEQPVRTEVPALV